MPGPSAAQGQQGSLRLLSREGARSLPTVTVNNQEYVPLDDLAPAFGITSREDQLAGGVTLTVGSRTIIVTPEGVSSKGSPVGIRSACKGPLVQDVGRQNLSRRPC